MLSFKEFLIESAPIKNLHLEHIEDEIFNLGVRGARESINFLRSLRDMLSGDSQSSVKLTVKFDGAAAVLIVGDKHPFVFEENYNSNIGKNNPTSSTESIQVKITEIDEEETVLLQKDSYELTN